MKILFILPNDFPYSGSCTSLLNNLLNTEAFSNSAYQVSVLSLGRSTIDQSYEKINNIDIYRTYLRSNISMEECKKQIHRHPWKVMQIVIHKIYAKISRKILMQPINFLEVEEIVRKVNETGIEQFDIIVPMFANLSIAAAGLRIKKRNSGKKVVLYQVDPCSSNEEYPSSMRKKLSMFEERLFKMADRIITTEILMNEAQGKYTDEVISKMVAMEFPNVIRKSQENHADTNGDVKCVFTGYIYSNIRDPEYTFRLFHHLDSNIHLELIGYLPPEEKTKSEKYEVIFHGLMPLQETRAEIEKAHILVNIGNSVLNQVPSKLFEYISYGKPIVNICKNRNCPTLQYLTNYPYALNLFEEEELVDEQRQQLRCFIKENYNRIIPFEKIQKEFETCTPQYCASQMVNVFDEFKKEANQ